MRFVQRWIWLAGAVATILGAVFVAFTLSGVQDATRAAGDLGELRAYAERIRGAAIAGDDERLAPLLERRRERMNALVPAIADVLGEGQSDEVFATLDRSFAALEEAAATGDELGLDDGVQAVTGQVNLLLDLIAAERDSAVELLRRLTYVGIVLAILGAVAGLIASLVSHVRVRQLTRSEAAANQRYEALIASMQNGILLLSDAGGVVYCNEAFAEMLGFHADELVGGSVDRFVSPELLDEFDAHRRAVSEQAAPMPPWLTRCRHHDGSDIDVFVAVTPLIEDGHCVATLWEFRNVTREVGLSHRVSLEAAKGEAVLEMAPVPIVVIDEAGVVIAANAAVDNVFGWPPDALVGQSVSVLMPEPFASRHREYLQHYIETGQPSTPGESVIGRERPAFALHRDGRQFPVSLQVAESRSDEGQRVFTGVIYDLTRQSNLEGERLQLLESLMYEQRDVAVGTMVGGVAHDFNNLLTAIIGALDLEISTRGESSRWLDHAAVSARRASTVVQRLLHTVRPHDSELYPMDVRAVMTETVDLARETFDRRVAIQSHVSGELPLVLGDSTRIGQVLLNLLINARDAVLERSKDAGPGYRPEIRIAAADTTDGERQIVRIMLSDNGVGMAPEVRNRIFDPFFTTKRGGKGSGLGLTMVRSIVREMDGDIRVDSNALIGTTVTIDLPALAAGVAGAEPGPDIGAPCVLVVDDEDAIREIVSAALRRYGCHAEVAASGEEALELLQLHGEYALVLLDLNMPGLTGWDVLARIRQRDPELPVIIMSGTAQASEVIRRGATGSLPKPFSLEELIQLVGQQLSPARSEESESSGTIEGVGSGT